MTIERCLDLPEPPLTTVSADQFLQLMAAIYASQLRMDDKLVKFRDKIRQGQENAAAKALKRARYDKPHVFRKRGNEEQANFNAKVDEALAQAASNLSAIAATPASTAAFQRVKEAIERSWLLLEECQKLIRLDDRSDHGWRVVDEYTANDLAADSDHERRIEKGRVGS